MSQIFISHVEEDESIALEIAHGVEDAGYSTWYYERDSLPGLSYLDQIDEAIEQCQAVVVIISLDSLSSWQVGKEVERAHESGKHFVPLLRGVKHVEFQARKPGWRMALGASTSISVPADGVSTIVPRVVAGLRKLVVNLEKSASSPPVNGQTASQDVSFTGPTDHSDETGEGRLFQSEHIAGQHLPDTTLTVRDAYAESTAGDFLSPPGLSLPNDPSAEAGQNSENELQTSEPSTVPSPIETTSAETAATSDAVTTGQPAHASLPGGKLPVTPKTPEATTQPAKQPGPVAGGRSRGQFGEKASAVLGALPVAAGTAVIAGYLGYQFGAPLVGFVIAGQRVYPTLNP